MAKSFRTRLHRRILLAPGLVLLASTAAANHEWPSWRGPSRTGISTESGWLPKGKAEALWSASVGLGYSCVSIAGGRLYTTGYDEEGGLDVVRCLDAVSGEPLWDFAFPAKKWDKFHTGGTNCTPVVDGERVYLTNREGKFFVFDAKTGEVLHEADLREDLDLELPTWGFAASPLVLDELVVLNVGRVLALDKESLDVRWDTKDYGHAYSTPTPFSREGALRLAVFCGSGLVVLDGDTGEELFFKEWKTNYDVNAASPVVDGDRVFISSGYDHGCAMIDLAKGEVVWESKVMMTQMTGCVLYEGNLYGFDGEILKCLDLEGNEVWRKRGLGDGSFMIADGKLIVVSSDGELIVAPATPKGFEETSRQKVLDGGKYWTSPVLSDGLIYVRNSNGQLVCRDHRTDS